MNKNIEIALIKSATQTLLEDIVHGIDPSYNLEILNDLQASADEIAWAEKYPEVAEICKRLVGCVEDLEKVAKKMESENR